MKGRSVKFLGGVLQSERKQKRIGCPMTWDMQISYQMLLLNRHSLRVISRMTISIVVALGAILVFNMEMVDFRLELP